MPLEECLRAEAAATWHLGILEVNDEIAPGNLRVQVIGNNNFQRSSTPLALITNKNKKQSPKPKQKPAKQTEHRKQELSLLLSFSTLERCKA